MPALEIQLLGPLAALRDGQEVVLGGRKQRAALAVLALAAGRVVPAERLIADLWGAEPPPTAATALQGHISRLRRLLGADAIVTRDPGYLLDVPPAAVDALRFEQLVDEGELARALELWRGPALADVAAEPGLVHEARRFDEARLAALEEQFQAELGRGRHAELIGPLEAHCRAEPLRERPVGQLMLALYRSGRQADALDAYRRFTRTLREEVGLEPGEELRALERRVLEHDPSLAPAEPPAPPRRRLPVTVVALTIALDGDGLDPELWQAMLADAREAARLALEEHGASVRRDLATGLLAVFGEPHAHEDDAQRALRGAHEALAAVAARAEEIERRFPVVLTARAGVASGISVGGDTPALVEASRLQATAAPGEVRVDDLTRARRLERQLSTRLAGRETEAATLRAMYLGMLRGGWSAVVAVTGPPGIGKSRLVDALIAELRPGSSTIVARCLSYGDGVSLVPIVDIVREAGGVSPDADPAQARAALADVLRGVERGDAALEQLLGVLGLAEEAEEPAWAVHRLLEAAARRGPIVVVFEDVQWASPPVLDLVDHLCTASEAPLLVALTARDLPRPLPAERIPLRVLEDDACAKIVESLLGEDGVADDALRTVVDASGGNPLYLEELVRGLGDAGAWRREDGLWQLEPGEPVAPRSIESLLAARIEGLPDAERDLLRRASVMGRSFALSALADLAEADVDETVAGLLDAELLQPTRSPGEDLEFRHLLIRDAAYESLPLAERAELHERYARWLERTTITAPSEREALVVYHLDCAYRSRSALATAVPDADRQALAARTAALGRSLLSRGDAAAAAALFARAGELEPGVARNAIELGRALYDVGDFPAAEAAFTTALGGEPERAMLGLLEVRLRTDPGADLDEIEERIDAAHDALARAGNQDGITEALFASAYIAGLRGNGEGLLERLERALEQTRRVGATRGESWLLFLLCGVCWYGPLPVADGIRRCERVLAEARGRPGVEAAAQQSLAVLHAMAGRFDAARGLVRASRALRRDAGQLVGAAASAIDEGIVELLAGDPVAAERVLRGGFDTLELLGEKAYFSTVGSLLAEALASQGRHEEARRLAGEAAAAASADDVASQVGSRAAEARALAALGDVGAAQRIAREAVESASTTDFLLLRSEAWAALADVTGDPADRREAVLALEQKGCARPAVEAWARPDFRGG